MCNGSQRKLYRTLAKLVNILSLIKYGCMQFCLVIFTILILSCNAPSFKSSIVGRWKYVETTYVSGGKIRWVSEQDSKGIVFTFKENDAFVFERIGDSSVTGIYKLIDSGKTIVSEIGNLEKATPQRF